MRELRLTLLPTGRVIFTYTGSLYNMEHNAMSVVVDYSTSPGYEAFIKRVEVNGLSAPMIYESVASDDVTFSLERASLAGKTISLQAIAYTLDGMDIDQEVKWQIITFPINDSLNLVESGEIPPSLANVIMVRLDGVESAIEDLDATKFEITSTNPSEGDVVTYVSGAWVNSNRFTIPRWSDVVFELTQTRQGTNLKPDFDTTNIGLLFPQNNTSEIVYITAQMPHSWLEGSTIYPHIHVIQTQNLQATFRMEYKWYNIGDVIPTTWSVYNMDAYALPYGGGTQSNIVKGNGISGVGKQLSSILKMRIFRNDNVYVGDILADQFDIHIQFDGFGSQEQFDKY